MTFPVGAEELAISFDHGRGSKVQVVLEGPLAAGLPYSPPGGQYQQPPPAGPAHIDTFRKSSEYEERTHYRIGSLTRDRGYEVMIFEVEERGRSDLVVEKIRIVHGDRKTNHEQNFRLREGRNIVAVPVPKGATDLRITFDHGGGARVRISLE